MSFSYLKQEDTPHFLASPSTPSKPLRKITPIGFELSQPD
jgi:hypothetical protein